MSTVNATYLEDIGVVSGSSANPASNTASINAALSSGNYSVLRMKQGATYYIGSSILMKSNTSLIGDDGPSPAVIYMPAANFNNTSVDPANRYSANAVGIFAAGALTGSATPLNSVELRNFKILSEVSQGRCIRAIAALNVQNLTSDQIEITGFPIGAGLSLGMIQGCSCISRCNIHDFYENSTIWPTSSNPQMTAIEIDGDVQASIPFSSGLNIAGNRIANMIAGPQFIATYGYQTDGINIIGFNTNMLRVSSNHISNIGEGIDCFGKGNLFSDNIISDAYNYGFKLTHGASKNVINGLSIQRAGLCGVTVDAANDASDVTGNMFCGLHVSDIDPSNVWAANSTACFRINGSSTYKTRNTLIASAYLEQGNHGKYGWLDIGGGSNNFGENISIIAGPSNDHRIYISSSSGSVRLAGSSVYSTNLT